MRITVVAVSNDDGIARVEQSGVAAVFPADTRNFKVTAELARILQPGMQAFGRVEERNGAWWLFAVQILGAQIPE